MGTKNYLIFKNISRHSYVTMSRDVIYSTKVTSTWNFKLFRVPRRPLPVRRFIKTGLILTKMPPRANCLCHFSTKSVPYLNDLHVCSPRLYPRFPGECVSEQSRGCSTLKWKPCLNNAYLTWPVLPPPPFSHIALKYQGPALIVSLQKVVAVDC